MSRICSCRIICYFLSDWPGTTLEGNISMTKRLFLNVTGEKSSPEEEEKYSVLSLKNKKVLKASQAALSIMWGADRKYRWSPERRREWIKGDLIQRWFYGLNAAMQRFRVALTLVHTVTITRHPQRGSHMTVCCHRWVCLSEQARRREWGHRKVETECKESVRNKEREPVAISDQQKASTVLIHIGFSSLQNTGLA